MATPTEKLKSSGHLTEQNIFLKQKKHFGKRSVLFGDGFSTPTSLQRLRAIQLQQYLELLKERERRAQQRNRQLLQQFEEAQSALDEMLACNAAMKTIRMEYEGYLEESAPRWLQQFKEKTVAVQKERVEKHFKSRQEEAEYPVPNLTADDSFPSQDAQKTVAPQGWSTPECRNNQDGRPHPFTQYSWLTHPQIQSSMFPLRGSNPPQTPALLSPPTISHPLLVHPLASSPCPPSQHGYPWLAGTSLGSHGYKEEPHPELRGFQNGENSKRRRGGSRNSQLSPEFDIKPVRLSSRNSESSGSSRGPTPSTKEKRKKRVEVSSSDVNSVETSSASVAESQLLKDPSSVKGSFRETQRSEGLIAASPRPDEEERTEKRSERLNERNRHSEEESGSSTKGSIQAKQGQQSHSDESERSRQGESEEEEQQGSESCERRNTEEEIQTKLSSREEEKRQKSQKDRSVEEDDCSMKTTTEEEAGTAAEEEDEEAAGTAAEEEDEEAAGTAAEEEDEEAAGTAAEEEDEEAAGTAAEEEDEEAAGTAAEKDLNEEQPNQLKEVDDEKIKDSSSSQDEDEEEMESSEKKSEEESRRDGGKTDSDDSIISPQNKSYKEKKIQLVLVMPAEESVLQSSAQTIPETAAEEEEEENTGSSNAVESSDGDDVENVLAPQDRKQKDVSHLDLFQVTEDRQKTELQGDSDEFDPFYD
ncbi:histone acetyltransferase KAT6A-like isoform X2 [Oryzias latipes]|uniref:histone acetyltransferase KAT6A-like isoform X2 n=1 Tax=Oryzias latipes TaxID=8090 RepID=UPI0005CB8B48|nr:histone acetyltransferase KAT6A-like isoform X2 [Oryzias latipes]